MKRFGVVRLEEGDVGLEMIAGNGDGRGGRVERKGSWEELMWIGLSDSFANTKHIPDIRDGDTYGVRHVVLTDWISFHPRPYPGSISSFRCNLPI
jgi:hypothetical protein